MQTLTRTLPPLWRRLALLVPLLCLSWLARAQNNAYFSAGTLSYETTGADNQQVVFRVQETYSNIGRARPALGQVGATFTLDFGDGTAPQTGGVRVTRLGGDDYTGEFTTTHTYATAGRYTATVRGSSRVNTLPFAFSAQVVAGDANDAPVATVGPIIVLTAGQAAATAPVVASDPNGDALTYRLATAAETGDATGFTNPPQLSVNPTTGLLTLNTVGLPAGQFVTAVVVVSDGAASIMVDQLLRFDAPAAPNVAPVFGRDMPPTGGPVPVYIPQKVTFTVRATDANPGDMVTLRATGLPPGATLTPSLPVSGTNVAEAVFSWQPTPSQQGLYNLTFTAEDSQGAQTTVPVQFEVFGTAPPVFEAPTPANGQVFTVVPGQNVSFTVKVSTPNTYKDYVNLSLASPLPPGATLTPSLPVAGQSAQTTFSWTPTSANVGSSDVLFQVQTPRDALLYTGVRINVVNSVSRAAPVFVAPTPTNGQVLKAVVGQPFTFRVRATDADSGDVVTLRAYNLPLVGTPTFTQNPATGSNPAEATFTWTPPAGAVGLSNYVSFYAQDKAGLRSAGVSVTIDVTAAPVCNPLATQPVANPDRFTSCGGAPVVVTPAQLLANDTDPLGRPLRLANASFFPPGNGTFVARPDGSFSYTLAPGQRSATILYFVQLAGPVLASSSLNHYYEFVAAPGICWAAAREAAAARTYQGLQGYLAAPTSASETGFLANNSAGGRYWIGASDEDVEGEWRWKTGPEAGQLFWRGGPDGTATSPGGANWSAGEPNDFKNQYRPAGEDYAAMYGGAGGRWNDLPACAEGSEVAGYVVEYGGLEACTPFLYATGTITITAEPTTPAVVAGADQLRTPVNSPLTLTAAQLLANDSGPASQPLQVSNVTAPGSGRLVTNADGTFTYTPDPNFVGTTSFSYDVHPAGRALASAATGHFYEFVNVPGSGWATARDLAASRTYLGLQGYLATITTPEEAALLAGRSTGNTYWFGASDNAVEGEWRWQTGPEAGQLFWRGAADGAPVNGAFTNWSPGEPNDYKNQYYPGGEDYAFLYSQSGLWNDASIGPGATGYLVEYGGLEACAPTLVARGTVTITVGSPAAVAAAKSAKPAATASARAAGGLAPVLEALPNPSDGSFRLRVVADTDGPAQVELFDLQGRRVKSVFSGVLKAGELRELPVSAPELATGIYMVRLQSGKQVQHRRIAIQH